MSKTTYAIMILILGMMLLCAGCGNSAITNTDTETEAAAVQKEITDIDEKDGPFVPLNLEYVQLLEDGTLILKPSDELRVAIGDKVTIASDATDVFVLPFGNGGFRSVIFIREDGSVSALDAGALINDYSIDIMNNLGEYTDVKTVKGVQEDDAFGINVVMNDGEEGSLDLYLQ